MDVQAYIERTRNAFDELGDEFWEDRFVEERDAAAGINALNPDMLTVLRDATDIVGPYAQTRVLLIDAWEADTLRAFTELLEAVDGSTAGLNNLHTAYVFEGCRPENRTERNYEPLARCLGAMGRVLPFVSTLVLNIDRRLHAHFGDPTVAVVFYTTYLAHADVDHKFRNLVVAIPPDHNALREQLRYAIDAAGAQPVNGVLQEAVGDLGHLAFIAFPGPRYVRTAILWAAMRTCELRNEPLYPRPLRIDTEPICTPHFLESHFYIRPEPLSKTPAVPLWRTTTHQHRHMYARRVTLARSWPDTVHATTTNALAALTLALDGIDIAMFYNLLFRVFEHKRPLVRFSFSAKLSVAPQVFALRHLLDNTQHRAAVVPSHYAPLLEELCVQCDASETNVVRDSGPAGGGSFYIFEAVAPPALQKLLWLSHATNDGTVAGISLAPPGMAPVFPKLAVVALRHVALSVVPCTRRAVPDGKRVTIEDCILAGSTIPISVPGLALTLRQRTDAILRIEAPLKLLALGTPSDDGGANRHTAYHFEVANRVAVDTFMLEPNISVYRCPDVAGTLACKHVELACHRVRNAGISIMDMHTSKIVYGEDGVPPQRIRTPLADPALLGEPCDMAFVRITSGPPPQKVIGTRRARHTMLLPRARKIVLIDEIGKPDYEETMLRLAAETSEFSMALEGFLGATSRHVVMAPATDAPERLRVQLLRHQSVQLAIAPRPAGWALEIYNPVHADIALCNDSPHSQADEGQLTVVVAPTDGPRSLICDLAPLVKGGVARWRATGTDFFQTDRL